MNIGIQLVHTVKQWFYKCRLWNLLYFKSFVLLVPESIWDPLPWLGGQDKQVQSLGITTNLSEFFMDHAGLSTISD